MSKRSYIETRHGQVHARRCGDVGPHVVLLHESPLSSMVYETALASLGAWCQALALDTLGYGMSDIPPQRLDIPGYAEPVVEILAMLDGPALIVGSHTGASIAIEVARQAPERVSGAVLLGIAKYDAQTQRERRTGWAPDIPLREDGSHLLSTWRRYQALWPNISREARQQAVWAMLGALDRYHWAYNSAFEYEPLTALTKLVCPVLAVAAEGEFLEPATRRAAESLGLPYRLVEGITGQISVRRPRELSNLLQEFASTLPGFVSA